VPIDFELDSWAWAFCCFCASYWSCNGAIEYVFNTLQTRLQMNMQGVENVLGLVNKINRIIGDMSLFEKYFFHVGFPDN
jgi:hypothetical protein